jgi:hypothetical protein
MIAFNEKEEGRKICIIFDIEKIDFESPKLELFIAVH